jgi:hypothetical protein
LEVFKWYQLKAKQRWILKVDIKEIKYCCSRFRDAVEDDKFIEYAGKKDETEWFISEGYHIYYCPFCGSYIAGEGFGKPPKPFNLDES